MDNGGNMNYNFGAYLYEKKKEAMMKRYFVADCDEDGEAISDSIFEINYEQTVAEVKEQIQEDIICYVEAVGGEEENADALCQIVVDNFKKLKDD